MWQYSNLQQEAAEDTSSVPSALCFVLVTKTSSWRQRQRQRLLQRQANVQTVQSLPHTDCAPSGPLNLV